MIMNKVLFFLLAVISIPGYTQEIQTRNVSAFSGIKVSQGIDVYLKKSDKETVRVEAVGTSAGNVLTEVSGSYLKIHLREGNFSGKMDIKVYVGYKQLEKLIASAAGSIFSEEAIKANEMEINCSSAGNVDISIDANTIEVTASSAGQIELKGKSKSLDAEASSAGNIDADDLECDNVSVEASSAGSAKVNVKSSLQANANSGATIRFKGNPSKSITNSSSGGTVRKTN